MASWKIHEHIMQGQEALWKGAEGRDKGRRGGLDGWSNRGGKRSRRGWRSEMEIRSEGVFGGGFERICKSVESWQTDGWDQIINPVIGRGLNNEAYFMTIISCIYWSVLVVFWVTFSAFKPVLFSAVFLIIAATDGISAFALDSQLIAPSLFLPLQSLESTRRMLALVEEVSSEIRQDTSHQHHFFCLTFTNTCPAN